MPTEDENKTETTITADAEGAKGAPRTFTQAELDEYAAKVRRDEKRKAQKAMDEFKTTVASLSPDKIQAQIAEGFKAQIPSFLELIKQAQAPQVQSADADKVKAEAEKARAAGQSEADKGKGSPTVGLPPEVQAQIDSATRRAEKVERELADERKARKEVAEREAQKAQALAKRAAIDSVSDALVKARPGLPKTAAVLKARSMIEDGDVVLHDGKVRYVIKNPDSEFEEDRAKEVSLNDGAALWAKSAEADDLMPAPIAGPGAFRSNVNTSRNSQANDQGQGDTSMGAALRQTYKQLVH